MSHISPARTDPRILRTRQALYDALLALVTTQPYDAITVQAITDHAGVRRATFYMHFKNKEELLASVVRQHFEEVVHQIEASAAEDDFARKSTALPFIILFRHVAHHHAAYRALMHSPAAYAVIKQLRDTIAAYIKEQLLLRRPAESLPLPIDILAQFVAGAEMSMLTWWAENDAPHPAEFTAEAAHRLTLFGLQGVLGFDESLLE